MSYMRGDQTCPHCYRVLIDLSKFDARADSIGLDTGGWGPRAPNRQMRAGLAAFNLLEMLAEWCGARVKQRRLEKVLRDYPHSLYCAGCGYIDRRR